VLFINCYDFVQQFIDYRVPIHKFDDLTAYDGSVIAERTSESSALSVRSPQVCRGRDDGIRFVAPTR